MKKIITILGARPQFIKAAQLSRLLRNNSEIREIIIHTGQHNDKLMSDIFFSELKIPEPVYNLNINGGNHGQMTGLMICAIEEILLKENPQAVIVYGDTNTTLAGSLAATKLHIPVFHIEAGLRSFNRKMPEEVNRVLTDHISTILFCPTRLAVSNLEKEGIIKDVYHVGDIMYDAHLIAMKILRNNDNYSDGLMKKFDFVTEDFAFLTIHRAESTDSSESFLAILEYVTLIAEQKNLRIIFAAHPRLKKLINECFTRYRNKIVIIDPISYIEMQFVLSRTKLVLTDSGGLQKEAYFHRVPCITLRSETEWMETIDSEWNILWKTNSYPKCKCLINGEYGEGNVSEKIIKIISRSI
ncbi:MAG: UDP-N-acetylglucosamine 2-epimerase (non-hydrolyzing) [Coxiellaceae bacterium]|jgi:UDP-GlcNAc3NAcA epimerase|nr:UDP-N-acetylglucosamine 2-epimerase (non-hydrolyzing) [Coxiellaceae bacterium]